MCRCRSNSLQIFAHAWPLWTSPWPVAVCRVSVWTRFWRLSDQTWTRSAQTCWSCRVSVMVFSAGWRWPLYLMMRAFTFCCVPSGEFQLRLRQLEKSLLQALNEVKGRILDDDTIITTLENLKKEAAEVTRKVEETDIVMQEVEMVSQQYLSLSSACSSIYFTMESLNQVLHARTHTISCRHAW